METKKKNSLPQARERGGEREGQKRSDKEAPDVTIALMIYVE